MEKYYMILTLISRYISGIKCPFDVDKIPINLSRNLTPISRYTLICGLMIAVSRTTFPYPAIMRSKMVKWMESGYKREALGITDMDRERFLMAAKNLLQEEPLVSNSDLSRQFSRQFMLQILPMCNCDFKDSCDNEKLKEIFWLATSITPLGERFQATIVVERMLVFIEEYLESYRDIDGERAAFVIELVHFLVDDFSDELIERVDRVIDMWVKRGFESGRIKILMASGQLL